MVVVSIATRASPCWSPTIQSRDNSGNWGGGIYCNEGSSPIISGNSITNNTAISHGGGIRSYNATPVILNNLFGGNSGLTGGGISIYFEETGFPPATVTGNIVSNNTASNGGGGIALTSTTTPVLNNIFTGNSALTRYGAGINVNNDSDVLIANNTITGNSADVLSGGGIAVITEASATLENNIMWGNSSPAGKELSLVDNSTVTINFCDVDGGQSSADVEAGSTLNWGGMNIDEDPLFCSGPLGDYYLCQDPCQPGVVNPCVNTGHPFSPLIEGTTRTDCHPDEGILDMGYHYALLDTVTADLGCVPDSGVLPFTSQFSVTLGNVVEYHRTIAGRINVILAGGASYQNWRAGYTNLGPNETFVTAWMQTLPALESLVGANVFELHVEDVTPTPYNQPPYPPSGDIDTATCTVMGEVSTK